jgi:NAD(P)-dependent dehydrogenase (short-subunit alcohol dehydrogenase family)
MSLSIDLAGQVALVTGASNGIGAGVAHMLALAGADVAGCGQSPASDAFEASVRAAGRTPLYVPTDVENPDDLARLVECTIERFGRLDIVVSNAGRNVFEAPGDCSEARWKHNMDLNLSSHWRLARLCKPHLERSDAGVIEIMTSNHAFATMPGCFPYSVAKSALTGLVRSLAIEWGPTIRVVGLAPGFVETPGNDKWFESFPDPAAERARTEKLHPVGRLGTCDQIGAWCAFLASSHAAFGTGTTYVMDGGRLALLQDAES